MGYLTPGEYDLWEEVDITILNEITIQTKNETVNIKRPYRFRISEREGAVVYRDITKTAIRDIMV